MQFYKKTACRLFLVGSLKEMSELEMDDKGEFKITLTIARRKPIYDTFSRVIGDTTLSYTVFLTGESALRIRQYGFLGLTLWIEGDFQNINEIYAEKITFIEFPESNETDVTPPGEINNNLDFHLSFAAHNRNDFNGLNSIH